MFGGRRYLTNLDYHYNGRIILFWWSDYYQLTKVSRDAQSITCRVEDVKAQMVYQWTVVYTFNTKEERRGLWAQLGNMNNRVNSPWLIIGDFNSILYNNDCIGGTAVTVGEVQDFKEYVKKCDLMELPYGGHRYTWNDKHGKYRIFPRLIRHLLTIIGLILC